MESSLRGEDMPNYMLRRLIAIAFTASGFAALAYQIAWQRVLTQVIGSDAISAVFVVFIFMACLGIGAELTRRLLARPALSVAKTYATIEVGIGIYGFFSVPLMRAVTHGGPRRDPARSPPTRPSTSCCSRRR